MSRETTQQIILVAVALLGLSIAPAAWANPTPQAVTNLTVTKVSDVDYGGELVEIFVSQSVVPGCTYADFYIVRDTNVIKGGLALALSALISSRSLDLYVTGTCDTSGRPLVINISTH